MAAYDTLQIDWVKVFSQWGQPKRSAGDNYSMRCPLPGHDDSHASFTFHGKTGMWQCHGACAKGGNGHQIFVECEGMNAADAFKHVMELGGVLPQEKQKSEKKKKKHSREPLTLTHYAGMKQLSVDFLLKLDVTDAIHSQWKLNTVCMPYKNEDGEVVARRYRTEGQPKFGWGVPNVVTLYGLWLDLNKQARTVVLVEGESDSHTLWSYDIPAYGVPGATSFNSDFTKLMRHVTEVLVLVEPPDEKQNAGEKFLQSIASAPWPEGVVVKRISTAQIGYKDPSDMHMQSPDFKRDWQMVVSNAVVVEKEKAKTAGDCPVAFSVPQNYIFGAGGIYHINKDGETVLVTSTAMCVDSVYADETGKEYVRICFRHPAKGWQYVTVRRGDVLSSRKILDLSDRGVDVTDVSSKKLVSWMAQLLRENPDIPYKRELTRGGWSADMKTFAPVMVDADSYVDTNLFRGYGTYGDKEVWKTAASRARESLLVRAIMAAYASSPLLKLINQRSFFFHIFSRLSGAGKTCAQMLACSIFGEPSKIIRSFNATATGLERAAAHHNDIGLCLDEYQSLSEYEKERFINDVYKLVQGVSRVRSNVKLESAPVDNWRLAFVTSGEGALGEKSHLQGVRNRIIECEGVPFTDPEEARKLYGILTEHYGHIGLGYIKYIAHNQAAIKTRFKEINEVVIKSMGVYRGAVHQHTSIISTLILTDEILCKFIPSPALDVRQFMDAIYGYEALKVPIAQQVPELFSQWLARQAGRIPYVAEVKLVRDFIGYAEGSIYIFAMSLDDFARDINLTRSMVISQLKEAGMIESVVRRHPVISSQSLRMWKVKSISKEELLDE